VREKAERAMFDQFELKIDMAIRPCREEDLRALEWFGKWSQYRGVIAEAFERQQQGEVMMLVADINRFPIGQLWIDLAKKREESVGASYGRFG
jgi:hypothetical protein